MIEDEDRSLTATRNPSRAGAYRTPLAQPRLRLRLLNAFDDQAYTLGFASGAPFVQVASDGGLLNQSVQLTRLLLGPERAEIVVDVSK